MLDTLSSMVRVLLSNEPSTIAYDEQNFRVFRIFTYVKRAHFFIRYFLNSWRTALQTHARIEIDSECSYGEIDACSRNICMKINTFVDFISTWKT